jgi:3-methyladenine DNA glycosylase AlkD
MIEDAGGIMKWLNLDENYIPSEAFEGDEVLLNGIFRWNITKIIEYIEHNKNSIIFEKINTADYYDSYSKIDEAYLPSVDISVPIILAEINPGKYIIIDGHHRLAKAYRDGKAQVEAYKLRVEQHINFFDSYKGYEKFVEYWNGKVSDQIASDKRKIIDVFYDNKDLEQSRSMAAYMKNKFEFLGLSRPVRNVFQEELIKRAKKVKLIDWDFVFECWDLPEREFQYLAVDYLVALEKQLQAGDIERLERLITAKPWWDTVDIIAQKLVGGLCRRHPELIDNHMLKWAGSDNIWLARTAILFQTKYKDITDAHLLGRIILMNNDSKEFFINKAIGWALREYSKTDREWVREFIENNTLAPLSVKEGSKYL